jgi:hypothetical protein
MAAERQGIICSHCAAICFVDNPPWPYCQDCGHRADRPRYLCDCSRCKNQRANLAREGKPRE